MTMSHPLNSFMALSTAISFHHPHPPRAHSFIHCASSSCLLTLREKLIYAFSWKWNVCVVQKTKKERKNDDLQLSQGRWNNLFSYSWINFIFFPYDSRNILISPLRSEVQWHDRRERSPTLTWIMRITQFYISIFSHICRLNFSFFFLTHWRSRSSEQVVVPGLEWRIIACNNVVSRSIYSLCGDGLSASPPDIHSFVVW